MATKDTVVQELIVNTLTQAQFDAAKEAGALSPYELYGTPDASVRLPVLTPMWFDHITNDVSWLRADTFSWQSGDVYVAAYKHLLDDYEDSVQVEDTYIDIILTSPDADLNIYTRKLAVGEKIYNKLGGPVVGTIQSFVDTGLGDSSLSYVRPDGSVYTSGGYGVIFVQETDNKWVRDEYDTCNVMYAVAKDGHKICTLDQESNVSALYESTGVAWYYILDTTNKRFKLPRTKWGFVGMRDGVGNYVPESLPDHNHSITTYSALHPWAGNSGATWQGTTTGTTGNASESNIAYQDGAPVQQRATQMHLYFYVGNFEQSAIEQTAGITTEQLNNKLDVGLGNATAETKATIVGWGMPDYSAGVTITSGFIAPCDGIISVFCYVASSGQQAIVSINGIETAGARSGGGQVSTCCQLPINKGDVVTMLNSTGVNKFYPFKGVN